MGFAVTCVAIRAEQRDALLAAAGVTLTTQDDPDGAARISAAPFGDHYLFWRNLRGAPLSKEPDWFGLSQAVPLIVLDVVDTAGAQVLRGFVEGDEVWSVSFMDDNDEILAIEGAVPVDVQALKARLREDWLARYPDDADQTDADLVAAYGAELPSRVFEEITGFYYEDGAPEGLRKLSDDLPMVKLGWDGKRKEPSDKPWWKFW